MECLQTFVQRLNITRCNENTSPNHRDVFRAINTNDLIEKDSKFHELSNDLESCDGEDSEMKSIFEFDDSVSCCKSFSFSTISQTENLDRFSQNENTRLVRDTRFLRSKRPSLDFEKMRKDGLVVKKLKQNKKKKLGKLLVNGKKANHRNILKKSN